MPVKSKPLGGIYVSDDVDDLIDADDIKDAVNHLRMGGGDCWECRQATHVGDEVSLIAHLTPTAAMLGFAYYGCAPPQLVDDRRNRRAALAMRRYIDERSSDVQAFAMIRSDPPPHGLLV